MTKLSSYLSKYSLPLLCIYIGILFMGSLWPKLSKHYQEGEISAGLYPKEGDNFKLVNMPAVYRLNDGKRRKYVSDTSFYRYPSNPAFDTPYEDGGILICDKAVVFSIPIGDFMPYKPGGVPKKYYHKSLTESFFISFFRKDKLKHFIAYAVLALFFLLFLQYHSNLSFTSQGIVVLVLGTSVGIIIELMQFEFIQGRDKELLDMVLNSVGLLAGILLYQGLFKTKFRLG